MCILEKGQVINHIVTLYRCNVVTVLEVVLKWMFLILQSATKDRESRLCAMNKVRGCVTDCMLLVSWCVSLSSFAICTNSVYLSWWWWCM